MAGIWIGGGLGNEEGRTKDIPFPGAINGVDTAGFGFEVGFKVWSRVEPETGISAMALTPPETPDLPETR